MGVWRGLRPATCHPSSVTQPNGSPNEPFLRSCHPGPTSARRPAEGRLSAQDNRFAVAGSGPKMSMPCAMDLRQSRRRTNAEGEGLGGDRVLELRRPPYGTPCGIQARGVHVAFGVGDCPPCGPIGGIVARRIRRNTLHGWSFPDCPAYHGPPPISSIMAPFVQFPLRSVRWSPPSTSVFPNGPT